MKILFTGGGTGGHIIPIIAIVREIRRIEPDKEIQFFFMGPKDDFGDILLSQEGIKVKHVMSGKIRRYANFNSVMQNIIDVVFKIPIGFLQSFFGIFFLSPDLIFSKGGFGSIPVVLVGKFFFIPIFLHESDVAPGMANKFLSRFALKIFVSFPKTEYFPIKKTVFSGNPIRTEILKGDAIRGRDLFRIFSNKQVILVMGGSQGSQRINDKILEILPNLLPDFEIIMQTGENNFSTVADEARVVLAKNPDLEQYFHPIAFLKEGDLKDAYAVANLVISRAGSGSVFEIAAVGKPSILIPLPEAAQNHQASNAFILLEKGGCQILSEENLTANLFLQRIQRIFADPEVMKKIGEKAKAFSKPEAAKIIAYYLLDYLEINNKR